MFRFASPEYLYLLILLPVLIGIWIVSMRARTARLRRFGNPELLRQLIPDSSPRRIRNKFILLLISIGLIIVALARPQLGSKLSEETREGIELIFAVDVSNSMLAQDFEPNRLERTKYAINRLFETLEQDRVGLIVFAGDAYVQLPVTSDYITARSFVSHVSPNMVSKQGTAIGAAINLSASAFSSDSEGSRVIVLISDGENHEDDARAAALQAAENGIVIYTIGIGTPEGSPIKIGNDYMRDEDGTMVVTKLDETTLQEIALLTGGAYVRSTNQSMGLNEIVERIRETEKTKFSSSLYEEYNEQYPYLLWPALALIFLNLLIISRRNRILARFNIFKSGEKL